MKGKMKKNVTLLCCTLAGACCLFGASVALNVEEVSGETTSVTMVAGAATRKDTENPGLKFTANISEYDASVQYGMLILPEAAFSMYTFNDDYVDVLDEAGKTYINEICTPYETDEGQWQIACSIVGINEENYTRQFVGIAYTLIGGEYDYADVNMLDNARSVTYVAQMALKYETDLTDDQEYALETYANPGCLLEETVNVSGIEDTGLTYGGEAVAQELNNALSVDIQNKLGPNTGSMSVITKEAYTGITEIKFDAKSGTTNSWWGIGIIDSTASASIYKQNLGTFGSHSTGGEWATFTYKISGTSWSLTSTSGLSKSGSFTSGATSAETTGYYIYVLGARGETFSEAIQFDNFSITAGGTTYTDDFNASINGGLFNTDANMQSVTVSSESEDAYDLETLLASGDINSVLYNGGYAYVQSSAAVSFANLPSTSLAIVGDFTYTITGEKAFALVLGGTESGMDYLYIDGTTLAFYNGTTLKKSVTLTSATNTVYVAVTAGGRVCVSVNDGDFIAVGNVTAYPTSAFKVVALGGDGNVAITDVNVSMYAYSAAPAYLSADEIEFTAYAPVTVENWGTGAVNPI